jgi:hypothetical protein
MVYSKLYARLNQPFSTLGSYDVVDTLRPKVGVAVDVPNSLNWISPLAPIGAPLPSRSVVHGRRSVMLSAETGLMSSAIAICWPLT